jgi:hypothetical protein
MVIGMTVGHYHPVLVTIDREKVKIILMERGEGDHKK